MQGQGGQGQVGGLGMTMAQDNINAQAQHFMQQSMSVGGSRTGYGNGQQGALNSITGMTSESFLRCLLNYPLIFRTINNWRTDASTAISAGNAEF
jgi:hypothetical protein